VNNVHPLTSPSQNGSAGDFSQKINEDQPRSFARRHPNRYNPPVSKPLTNSGDNIREVNGSSSVSGALIKYVALPTPSLSTTRQNIGKPFTASNEKAEAPAQTPIQNLSVRSYVNPENLGGSDRTATSVPSIGAAPSHTDFSDTENLAIPAKIDGRANYRNEPLTLKSSSQAQKNGTFDSSKKLLEDSSTETSVSIKLKVKVPTTTFASSIPPTELTSAPISSTNEPNSCAEHSAPMDMAKAACDDQQNVPNQIQVASQPMTAQSVTSPHAISQMSKNLTKVTVASFLPKHEEQIDASEHHPMTTDGATANADSISDSSSLITNMHSTSLSATNDAKFSTNMANGIPPQTPNKSATAPSSEKAEENVNQLTVNRDHAQAGFDDETKPRQRASSASSESNVKGEYKCGIEGCNRKYPTKAALKKHQDAKWLFCTTPGCNFKSHRTQTAHDHSLLHELEADELGKSGNIKPFEPVAIKKDESDSRQSSRKRPAEISKEPEFVAKKSKTADVKVERKNESIVPPASLTSREARPANDVVVFSPTRVSYNWPTSSTHRRFGGPDPNLDVPVPIREGFHLLQINPIHLPFVYQTASF
jgi:hypothetical protein